ncbi:MAG: glycosyl hydrolase family 18 [Brevundimonas sp.]|nr:MAG: glycosyl hydrolase family 18 [Brevundimonas sp.]
MIATLLQRLAAPLILMSALAGGAAQAADRPVMVGYIQTHHMAEALPRIDLAGYTHVNLAFANPDATGAIMAGDRMTCMSAGEGVPATLDHIRAAVSTVHAAGGKVLISLGGGQIPGCSGDWAALLGAQTRAAVVESLLALVDQTGLDGIDVDLEGELLTKIDQAGNYTPFIAELSQGLKARGKLLTCATASYEGGMIPVSSIPYFDLVNVMSYDAVGLTWGTPGDEHSSFAQAQSDMRLWRARGVARDRLVLGVPYYGYGFGALKGGYDYREILAQFGDRMDGDVVGRRCGTCDYITFNGVETLRRKARLAMQQGAGVMVWEMPQDTDDGLLLRTLREGLGAH